MGSKAPTTTSTQSIPPQVLAQYQTVVDRANNVASTPYQAYGNKLTEDLNAGQSDAIAGLRYSSGNAENILHGIDTNQAGPDLSGSIAGLNGNAYLANGIASNASGLSGAAFGFANNASALGSAAPNISSAANPYVGIGANLVQAGANNYTAEAAKDFASGAGALGTAQGYLGQGANTIAGAQPYFQSAASTLASAQPYYQQASDYNAKSTGPLNTQNYMSPYQSAVIDSTLAQINRQNGIAQNQALGAGIKAGNAFGGDRQGLAASQLASDQGINTNKTLADLNNQNYAQAIAAAQNEASRYGQAANVSAGLGNAQIQAGGAYNTLGNSQITAGNAYNQLGSTALGVGQGYGSLGSGLVGAGNAMTSAGNTVANIGQNYQGGLINAGNYGIAANNSGISAINAALSGNSNVISANNSGINANTAAGNLTNTAYNSGINANNLAVGNALNANTGYINANNAALAGSTQQQQTDQNFLNAQYQQWANATAFPYQQTSWLNNISTGIGSGSGGTTTSTGSAPNIGSQILGGGLALGSLSSSSLLGGALSALPFLKRGGVVPERAQGGAVGIGANFPMAGYPIDMNSTPGGTGLIPTIQINQARLNAPAAIDPNKGQSSGLDPKAIAGLGNGWLGQSRAPSYGATSSMGDPTGLGGLYAGGGVVRGYASGGMTFDDRYAPVDDAMNDFTFSPYKMAPETAPMRDVTPAPMPSPGLVPEVVNPTAPIRMDGSYRDLPENAAPISERQAQMNYADSPATGLDLPPEIARGMSRPQAQEPSLAMAYDAPAPRGLVPTAQYSHPERGVAPAQSDSLVGKLFGVGDDGRQALLSLGLGLLANRSPNFGTALGESGLGAVGTLNTIQANRAAQADKERAAALKEREFGLDVRKLDDAAKQAKEGIAVQRERLAKEYKPTYGIVGEDPTTGTKQYGWIDPNKREVIPQVSAAAASPTAGLVGEEYLAAIPEAQRAIVKKLANYEIDPKSLSMKGGHREALMSAASRVNPDFDAINYNARAMTRKDFTSGKSAQNISSFNTAIGHLDTLDKSVDALGNRGSSWYNKVSGVVSEQIDPKYQKALKEFQTARTAVSDELTRAFRGSGGNVHDIKQWEAAINTADSPEALHSATKQAMELLRSRIEAVGDQYNRGMNTNKEAVQLLSPKAQSAVSRLMGESGDDKPADTKKKPEAVKAAEPAKVSMKSEYTALPSGAEFVGADGKRYRKP